MEEKEIQNSLLEDDETKVEAEYHNEAVIDKPYDPKLIDIRFNQLALFNIIRRLREDAIDLYPDFQRNADLWNQQKQSLLIESIIIRIPLPAFYFDGENNEKWQVIDGLQRLCTIKNFVVDQTLKLKGLEYLRQFEDFTFGDLPLAVQRQIEETNITAYIINSKDPKVKYNIFKRINTGGVVLNPQEIRNALNQGIPADFVSDLATCGEFKLVTKLSTKRMQDKEFITRFLTFYLYKPSDYKPDLDTFMSNAMGELNHHSQEELNAIKHNFTASMLLSNEIFGKWAFKKVFNLDEKLYPVNKALFEVWSVVLAQLTDLEREKIKLLKDEVFFDYIKLIKNDNEFVASITSQTDNKNKIIYRFSKIEQLIKNKLL